MTTIPQPGWYPDPSDPTLRRWWDGAAWTEHAAPLHDTASTQAAPIAASVVSAAPAAPVAPKPPDLSALFVKLKGDETFTSGLRQSLNQRQPATLVGGLSYGAGLLLALSFIALFSGSISALGAVVVGMILIAGAWVVAVALRTAGVGRIGNRALEFTPLATVSAFLGVFLFVAGFSVLLGESAFENNDVSPSLVWGPLLLAAIMLFALWALPGLQGRPFLLGASLTTLGLALANFVGLTIAEGPMREVGSFNTVGDNVTEVINDITSGASAIALLFGLALMATVLVLDALGWNGVATPVLVAGWANIIIGSGFIGLNPGVLGGLILIVVLIGVVTVGALGRRRATMWIGTGLLPIVLGAGVGFAMSGDPSPVGIAFLGGFAGLLVLAAAVAALLWGPRIREWYQDFSRQQSRQLTGLGLS